MAKKISKLPNNYKVTLKSIAKSIYPDWSLQDWFEWPPNMFALISIVLQRTGSYRICLLKPELWHNGTWESDAEEEAKIWIEYSNNLILGKTATQPPYKNEGSKILRDAYKNIKDCWTETDLNDLRIISDLNYYYDTKHKLNYKKSEEVINFTTSLIKVFAIADCCCSGLGLVGQINEYKDYHLKLFKAVANLLLNNTGSLSTISKIHGVVLPKMRTPQHALVLRALSHHLTFHCTEVEVMWRTFPWLNHDRQSLNILAVPYPTEITEKNFRKIKNNSSHGYFHGNDKTEQDIELLNSIVGLVGRSIDDDKDIDIIVFPETSLTRNEYNILLEKLKSLYSRRNKNRGYKLPMIIAGVISFEKIETSNNSKKETELYHNELRMATFFAGKWYEITQRKHHRWTLKGDQIQQYQLDDHLEVNKAWTEYSSIFQRRLSVLAPNGWLALTSLICEDLARQEPIGEVLRGIGPTLLIALLSDGPQLTNRWSARYASVLTDDPGTAVLSLTSAGMAKRSRKKIDASHHDNNSAKDEGKKENQTVGLWRDMTAWKELSISNDENLKGLQFTLVANFEEEFTLDGRHDHKTASVIQMTEKINQVSLNTGKGHDNKYDITSEIGTWNDIRELSAAFFSIDAIIDLLQLYKPAANLAEKKSDSINAPNNSIEILLKLLEPRPKTKEVSSFLAEIKNKISFSWEKHNDIGIEAIITETNDDMKRFVEEVRRLKGNIFDSIETPNNMYDFFELIINYCESQLKKLGTPAKGDRGVPQVTIAAFLYGIHTKLSYIRNTDKVFKGAISIKKAQSLTQSIEEILENNQLIR